MPVLSGVDFRVGSVRPVAIYQGSQQIWLPHGIYPAGMQTLAEPTPGSTLASGGNLATAISGLSSGQTLYLASGGTYTLTGVTTMPSTKPGIKIATVPGGDPARITGNFQFRMYGNNQEVWRVKFDQQYVAGKNIEVSGDGQAMVECDFTNAFNTAAASSTNAGAMVLFTLDGPNAVCSNFLMYGCYFHQIGKVNSTFDHALYLQELNGGLFHSNNFYQIHGGYSFHSYPRTKNVEIAYNRHYSGLFTTLWEDVAGTAINNYYHNNVWYNNYTGMAHAPVEGNPQTGNNNRYRRNAGWNTNTAQGGNTGISASAGFAVIENLVQDPQFANPAGNDFTIGNQAVQDHIDVAV